MISGDIQVAFHRETHVIRLLGDVRLNLCSSLEDYVADMMEGAPFTNVMIDLTHAEGLDSTTLGQIAKISIICREKFDIMPTITSPNPGITQILLSMGFDQVFHIIDEPFEDESGFCRWVSQAVTEDVAREQVISAHKVLMSLNEKNKNEFQELIDCLESDRQSRSASR